MTRLINAKLRLQRAREACPHWDQESDGGTDCDMNTRDCCIEVYEARAALWRAKQSAHKGER